MLKDKLLYAIVACLIVAPCAPSMAEIPGSGAASLDANAMAAHGWSAKKTIIGHDVYDEHMKKIGAVDDMLLDTKSGRLSAVIGVGGFLGIDERYVRVDLGALRMTGDKLVWAGVDKTQVGAMPAVDRENPGGYRESLDRFVLGRRVYNAKNETIGTIADIIVAPDRNSAILILSAGPYLGMARHDVVFPVSDLHFGEHLRLPAATKDSLRAMAPFQYAD